VFSSIKRRDTTVEDEFPQDRVTVAEVVEPAKAAKGKPAPTEPAEPPAAGEESQDPEAWPEPRRPADTGGGAA